MPPPPHSPKPKPSAKPNSPSSTALLTAPPPLPSSHTLTPTTGRPSSSSATGNNRAFSLRRFYSGPAFRPVSLPVSSLATRHSSLLSPKIRRLTPPQNDNKFSRDSRNIYDRAHASSSTPAARETPLQTNSSSLPRTAICHYVSLPSERRNNSRRNSPGKNPIPHVASRTQARNP